MLISHAYRVSPAERTGKYVRRIAGHFAEKIRNQFDVEIGGIRSTGGFIGETETQQVDGVNVKSFGEFIKVFPPHETGRTGADAVNKDNRRTRVLSTGNL